MSSPHLPYVADCPYELVLHEKTRRRVFVGRFRHHGFMPRTDEARIAFRVRRRDLATGVETAEDVLEWGGACWTPIRRADGSTVAFAEFAAMLRGEAPGETFLDPFASPLLWEASRRLDRALRASAQVRHLPESPARRPKNVTSDGADAAGAHAARIAEHLACIAGAVCVRVPSPVWHVVADAKSAKEFWDDRNGGRGTATPLWTPLPFAAPAPGRKSVDESWIDARLAPVPRDTQYGFFLSWHRFDELRGVFGDDLKIAGEIEPASPRARDLIVPDQDLALTANVALRQALHQIGADLNWLDDGLVDRFLEGRALASRAGLPLYGDPHPAREAFAAVEPIAELAVREAFAPFWEKASRGVDTAPVQVAVASRVAMARWHLLGPERRAS